MEEIRFEKAVEKLEKIVEYLEGENVSLDEALKRYEEGVKLARFCRQKLAQAEKKLEVLTRGLDGSLQAEPLDVEEDGPRRKKGSSRDQGLKDTGDKGLLL